MATGTITQIIGPVVDVRFDEGLPAIKHALHVKHDKKILTLEVVQHLGLNRARCIAMQDTAGLARLCRRLQYCARDRRCPASRCNARD